MGSRLETIRTLVADCNEQELLAVLSGLPGWIGTSDAFVDTFHSAFDAIDEACVQYGRVIEQRRAA